MDSTGTRIQAEALTSFTCDVLAKAGALVDLIASQSDDQSDTWWIRELERIRDDNLVAIMDALAKQNDGHGWGAGELLKSYRERLTNRDET